MTEANLPGRDVPVPDSLEVIRRRRLGVRAALEALERAVAAPSAGRDRDWIAGVVDREAALGTAFDHHVEVTEGPDGLFAEVVAHSPRLIHEVTLLQAEHVSISDAIAAAIAFGRAASGREASAEVREAALDVMNRITRHRHTGAGLVYEAYNVDIEAAD